MSWLSSAINIWTGKAQQKRDTAALGEFRGGYLDQSPAELEYAKLLQGWMKKGALPVAQLEQQVSQRVGEFTQQGTAAVQGGMYNIGLGGTAASASAVGRVQAKALQAIAEQSRAIQVENEMTKIAAGGEYGRYGAGRSDTMRRMAEMILQGKLGISGNLQGAQTAALGDVASTMGNFIKAYIKSQGGGQGQSDTAWT